MRGAVTRLTLQEVSSLRGAARLTPRWVSSLRRAAVDTQRGVPARRALRTVPRRMLLPPRSCECKHVGCKFSRYLTTDRRCVRRGARVRVCVWGQVGLLALVLFLS